MNKKKKLIKAIERLDIKKAEKDELIKLASGSNNDKLLKCLLRVLSLGKDLLILFDIIEDP